MVYNKQLLAFVPVGYTKLPDWAQFVFSFCVDSVCKLSPANLSID